MQQNDTIQVLIVDDEQDIRDASERILTRSGFKVLTAEQGDKALALAKAEPVAIMLLDLKMPGMDGMEVLRRLRDFDETILVIVITGYATVETAIEAMKQGAYDFISKPFEPDQLRMVVNRASEKIQLIRETAKLEEERQRTWFDLDTEKSRIRTVLESLPNGVLVTNNKGQVVLMNPACRKLLLIKPDTAMGQDISRYVSDEGLADLVREISQGRHVDFDDIPTYEFAPSEAQYLLARGQPVLSEKKECLGAVVNLMDITDMKLLERLKTEFIEKATHELRSPLSTIHEQLSVVIGDMIEIAPPNDKEILARAQEKTRGLISLIGDLLDLSRIEEGVICRDQKPIRVDNTLKSIVSFLKTKAEAKNQTLTLTLPETPLPEILADPLALESIFGNLITNAINYTPDGGTIRVTGDLAGINVRVTVADNGFGIEARHLEKIFERFYRVKDEKTRYITGTGLGLSIVKELIVSLGGRIDVESTPGQGSVFTVLLPVRS